MKGNLIMDEIKHVMTNKRDLFIGIGISILAIGVCVVIAKKTDQGLFYFLKADQWFTIPFFVLVCSAWLLFFMIRVCFYYFKMHKMYKRVSGTPELQEEMIKDFREAEDLWNKRSLWIGEKYIYKPLYGIFPKSEANCFFYDSHTMARAPFWYIYINTKRRKKIMVWRYPLRVLPEREVQDMVDYANALLKGKPVNGDDDS